MLETLSPIWITDDASLAHHCQQWHQCKALALDTEFVRTTTFYAIPGLIQVGTEHEVFLIDPLSVHNWQPLANILDDQNVLKVLHACGEDLEVLHYLAGTVPTPMFDTQVAAAFANLGYSMGYQSILSQVLNIDVPKDETRSDWLMRPLTDSQIQYAAIDVYYLLRVYQHLDDLLSGSEKRDWLQEECDTLCHNAMNTNTDNAWLNVKNAWQLNRPQLAVLKALCTFRENTAREKNVPRTRVIPNESLWNLARFQPTNMHSLSRISGMRPDIRKVYGSAIMGIIVKAKALNESQWPHALPKPLPKSAVDKGKVAKAWLHERAEDLNICSELVTPSKLITPLLRLWLAQGQFSVPDSITGWRREKIVAPLVAYLNK